MADGNSDRLRVLLPSKNASNHSSLKGEARDGNAEEKGLTVLLDDTKDQATSESCMPLSPQWLIAKSTDTKMLASGDKRATKISSHGACGDTNLKNSWRLDGPRDKKDWKRPDLENGRCWREEERKTNILGRRDHRKEDRFSDITSTRDVTENRTFSSSERWHDVSSRGSGLESQRDYKQCSRWGPENKEKGSRNEKRTNAEKENAPADKQAFVGERDSRDKWRPPHRLEAQEVGSASYRSDPGFGSYRGRVEGSNVRFSAGGRSNVNGSLQIGRLQPASVIGSLHVERSKISNAYCYPRGKLLDIYRKHMTALNFDTLPDVMVHLSPITQEETVEPLALVPPGAEEKGVLGDIWKGKTTSSGVLYNSFRDTSEGKQNFSCNRKDIVESSQKAAVNDNYRGNHHAETFSVSDSQR